MNGKQILKKLEENGWKVSRIEGSHHIMFKEGYPRAVPVPVHGTADVKIGLLKAIERQTGVKLT